MQRRVLIVDDEPEICEMIQRVVNSAGMEALSTTDSARALDVIARGKFDLVFLDFHMGQPDGLDLARRMRSIPANRSTPVVLISDDQRPSALSIGFGAGASFFLYKPIDRDRVLRLLRAAQSTIELERRRMRRIPIRHKVTLKFNNQDLEAETIDMSLTGMLVEAHRVFPAGSRVGLRLQLSEGAQPVLGLGSVARTVGSNRMGIHMNRLS